MKTQQKDVTRYQVRLATIYDATLHYNGPGVAGIEDADLQAEWRDMCLFLGSEKMKAFRDGWEAGFEAPRADKTPIRDEKFPADWTAGMECGHRTAQRVQRVLTVTNG